MEPVGGASIAGGEEVLGEQLVASYLKSNGQTWSTTVGKDVAGGAAATEGE